MNKTIEERLSNAERELAAIRDELAKQPTPTIDPNDVSTWDDATIELAVKLGVMVCVSDASIELAASCERVFTLQGRYGSRIRVAGCHWKCACPITAPGHPRIHLGGECPVAFDEKTKVVTYTNEDGWCEVEYTSHMIWEWGNSEFNDILAFIELPKVGA